MEPTDIEIVIEKHSSNKVTDIDERSMSILKDPKLFENITRGQIGRSVVGEEDTVDTILLGSSMSLVENADQTSSNYGVGGESRAGKDYTVKETLGIWNSGRVEAVTSLSPKALKYWHANEPGWTWDGKILYVEDAPDDLLNSPVFKTMMSNGSKAVVAADYYAKELDVNGKPVIFVTFANANPPQEVLNRFTSVQCDDSKEQTRRIVKAKGINETSKKTMYVDEEYRKALSHLKRVPCWVPFAERLSEYFPDDLVVMRSVFPRFLDLIRASCALHQFQRGTDDGGYLIATEQDYGIALKVLKKTTQTSSMAPLTSWQKKILDALTDEYQKAAELEPRLHKVNRKTLYENLEKLRNMGLVDETYLQGDWREVRAWKRSELSRISSPKDLIRLPARITDAKGGCIRSIECMPNIEYNQENRKGATGRYTG